MLPSKTPGTVLEGEAVTAQMADCLICESQKQLFLPECNGETKMRFVSNMLLLEPNQLQNQRQIYLQQRVSKHFI